MEKNVSQENLYDRLISVNHDAFDAGMYDVAYHALAGAMHCAREMTSDEPLLNIARLAKDQIDFIDANHPEYEHSSRAASQRNHDSIFYMAARQAEVMVEIRRHNRARV